MRKPKCLLFYCWIFPLLFLITPVVNAQQTLTTINGWNAYVHLPANYNGNANKYPTIIFFPGIGEIGTNASKVIANGPGAYISQGWNGDVTVDGNTVSFIVISLQPVSGYPNEWLINQSIQTIKGLYRVDPNRLYLTGLSHGGWCSSTFVTGDAYGGPYTYASQVAAVATVEGVIPDDNQPYPNLFDNFANSGGHYLGFEQALDGRDTRTVVDRMNATKPGSAVYVKTNFGGGGHCCWNQFYGGQGVQPGIFVLDGVSQNLYQWLARQSLGPAANMAPIASAGANQVIDFPVVIANLNGSGTDPDGAIAGYSWRRVSGPLVSVIVNASAAQTSVINLIPGTYEFELTVTDDDGATDKDTVSLLVNGLLAPNILPVVNAGNDTTITLPVNSLMLRGTANDPDGSIAQYSWAQVSGPSAASITNASTITATAGGLTGGTYRFSLKVTDNSGGSASDTVQVKVNNAPHVDAGTDISIILPTNTATLNGSATDANGTVVSYSWSQASGPTTAGITTSTASSTTVTGLEEGVYKFVLEATDNDEATGTDTVSVVVAAPQPSPNNAPAANAGDDITIVLPINSVTVTGTGTDTDGTITGYAWSQVSGPSQANIADAASAVTGISGLVQGQYDFVLTVTDNSNTTATDTLSVIVQSGANILPVANAGTDINITLPVNTATLDGSGTDADGTVITYAWTQLSGPSASAIATAGAAVTAINNLVAGVYSFVLTVTDNSAGTGNDTVLVTVNPAPNQAPAANAGNDIIITLPVNTATLHGSGTDADGTIATYAWAQVSGPAAATIAGAGNATTAVNNLVQGQYRFALTVTDNNGATASDTVTVFVNAPACNSNQPVTYIISPTAPGEIYIPNASARPWKAGDTLKIPAGNYSVIEISNFKGDECRKIVIINSGGRVFTPVLRFKNDAKYFRITGTGTPGIEYGFKVTNGALAFSLVHDVEADHIEMTGGNLGIYCKTTPEEIDMRTVYIPGSTTNYVMSNIFIHHNYIHDVAGEGMYIGHSNPNGGQDGNGSNGLPLIPIRMDNIEIANNRVENTDWDGIQLSNARNNAKIHDNYIRNFGRINLGSQQAGIILGGNTNGDIYNNSVIKGTGNGIEVFGYGLVKLYGNTVDSTGWDGTATGQESVFLNDLVTTPEINPKQQIQFYNNSVNHPKTKAAVRVSNYNNNSLAASVHDNKFCIPGAPANWQSIYLLINAPGSTLSNNVLYCAPSSNVPPTANAGVDKVITLPVNSVTLTGTGTDPDGTISSYQWTKISGPAAGTIGNASLASTSVSAMVQGIYKFELLVTDNAGATGKDTLQITVKPAVNIPPVANAGNNQSITWPQNAVSLSGSGTDADGTVVSYQWTKIAGPVAGSIINAALAVTSVNGMAQGVYKFQLQVTDNNGATGKDTVQVTVNAAGNIAPSANAGLDRSITLPVNTTVLNGSGTDPDGSISGYQWTKVSGPADGSVTNANAATAIATALVEGVYKFELIVIDNNGAIGLDTVQVIVNAAANIPPTANAGIDKTITLPINTTSLAGSGTDIDGTITAYQWTKISGPAAGNIVNAASAVATATALVQGVYTFELRVTDNNGANGRDTIKVTVNPPANIAPIANAGLNQNITLPVNTSPLNGSGSDPDGTVTAYLWRKISGPAAGGISNPNTANATATGLAQGVYRYELRVTDNNGAFGRDTMQVTVNAGVPLPNIAPTADAGLDQNITLPVNTAPLNGSGTDPDGTVAAYQWTKIGGPAAGSISNATAAGATATGLIQGVYRFELRVTDNNGAIDRDTMQVTVNAALNIPPTANAGPNKTITLPVSTLSLVGSGTDPDGTVTAYQWTKIAGPATGGIANATAATATAIDLVQGVYSFELRVTDNDGATGRDTMKVSVNPALNIIPTANAGLDQNITLPVNTAPLNGSATDPDGTITAYLWTKISGPTAGTIANATNAVTTATALALGVYRFELRVTDNRGGIDRDTVQVTVNAAANIPPVANAGADRSITLPVNSTPLTGTGTDADGTIAGYQWTKIAGPVPGSITNPVSANATAVSLVQGVYKFELKVTDNNGAIDRDTMQVTVNAAANIAPVANAGANKTITLPVNTTTLNGSGTDADGTISGYLWTRISGPAAGTILNAASAVTSVAGLVQGVYKFELRVTDNNGTIGRDTMQVTVLPAVVVPNIPPIANAGNNISINLPENSTSLSGSGTDADGTIVAYSWAKVSGPATGAVMNATSASATASGLVEGIYLFELRVTDNSGGIGKDTVRVTVNATMPVSNVAPVAHAGSDSTIYLPENTITLDGSGEDADGTVASYQWRVLSGPVQYFIADAANPQTVFNDLEEGIYFLELLVTDNDGAVGRDTVIITIGSNRLKPDVNNVEVYPNPVTDFMKARISAVNVKKVRLVLFDSRGGQLYKTEILSIVGIQVENINMMKYASGTYFLQVTFEGSKPIIKKVIKQ